MVYKTTPAASKLISFVLDALKMYEGLFLQKQKGLTEQNRTWDEYIDYLSRYENGIIRFSSPLPVSEYKGDLINYTSLKHIVEKQVRENVWLAKEDASEYTSQPKKKKE